MSAKPKRKPTDFKRWGNYLRRCHRPDADNDLTATERLMRACYKYVALLRNKGQLEALRIYVNGADKKGGSRRTNRSNDYLWVFALLNSGKSRILSKSGRSRYGQLLAYAEKHGTSWQHLHVFCRAVGNTEYVRAQLAGDRRETWRIVDPPADSSDSNDALLPAWT